MIPYKKSAYKLFHEGALALAEVQQNGIKIDTDYLKKTIKKTNQKIKHLEAEQKKSEVAKTWKKVYKRNLNFDSNDQLGKVLFDHMKIEPPALTPTGKYKTDEKSLKAIDHSFVKNQLKIRKLKKILSTYLIGFQKETVNGLMHPFFNLHVAKTFRSSSTSPNFQNIPKRDKEAQKITRTAIIAREGHNLVEIDYSGLEVMIAATYHKDPVMIEYLSDPTKDMHRDMAMECYKLSEKQVSKEIRFYGKNNFVFPQFYGSSHVHCAKNLWESIGSADLKINNEIPLKTHLIKKGITELGDCFSINKYDKQPKNTFVRHIQEVQQRFWGDRFKVYAEWKNKWYKKYLKRGWMLTKTGFICQGYLKRNQIINYPVQGSAFHCLLWSLTQMVKKELKKRKMKSLIVGQIHDSILGDVPHEELNEYLVLINDVTTNKLVKKWKWINVPLEVEAEVCPVGGSWADKKEMEIPK